MSEDRQLLAAAGDADAPRHQSAGLIALLASDARTPAEVRDAVDLFHGDRRTKLSRFWLQLTFAAIIATAGILTDSTATVIGAMIIAPLGTPIQGVARALAAGDLGSLLRLFALVVGAGTAVVGIGALLGWVLPELIAPAHNAQITGRTSPTIIDLLAAAATGLIGAFALARRDIGDILPGVAIAISLVPPLAVVGLELDVGDLQGAFGAFLLFATNVLAMVFLGAVVLRILGVVEPAKSASVRHRREAFAVIGVGGLIVVSLLATTTTQTVRMHRWANQALDVATLWAASTGDEAISASFDGADLVIEMQGAGDADQPQIDDLRLALRQAVPAGTPVVLHRVAGSREAIGKVPPAAGTG